MGIGMGMDCIMKYSWLVSESDFGMQYVHVHVKEVLTHSKAVLEILMSAQIVEMGHINKVSL